MPRRQVEASEPKIQGFTPTRLPVEDVGVHTGA